MWIWAQVHGSFVLGIGLLALYRGPWALLAAALTVLNPNGLGLWELVLGYGTGEGSRGLVHHFVEEWGWLTPSDAPQIVRMLCLAIAGVLVWTDDEWRPRLVWLAVTALAVRHWRYCDPAGIALLPFVARRLETLLPRRPEGRPDLILAAALGFTAVLSPPVEPDPETFPPDVIATLSTRERIWSDFTLGGWLAWHGHEVFWDSRNDCYPVEVVEDGLRVAYRLGDWPEVLSRWGVQTVVTADDDLAVALEQRGWAPSPTEALHVLRLPVLAGGGTIPRSSGGVHGPAFATSQGGRQALR